MTAAVSVYLASAYDDPEPISTMKHLARIDRREIHRVVDDPETADIILFVENSHYHADPNFSVLRRHPLVRNYRAKCFMYNEHDRPWCILPGVYCSMDSRYFQRSRQRACSYIQSLNPFIEDARVAHIRPDLLFSFVGRRNHRVRDRVLSLHHPDSVVVDSTSTFNAFANAGSGDNAAALRSYAETIARSQFVLCPRGVGTSTYRLFETMRAGRVPVIVSDGWVRPDGPDWDKLSVRIPEREVARIPQILSDYEASWQQMARAARAAWDDWFSPDVKFHRMVESCVDIHHARRLPESVAQRIPQPTYIEHRTRAFIRPIVKRMRQ